MFKKKVLLVASIVGALTLSSCQKETPSPTTTVDANRSFVLGSNFSINNVWELPALAPGKSDTTQFTAGMGERLTMATMIVPTNDWFLTLSEIRLSTSTNILNISSVASTWDAGTEKDDVRDSVATMYQPPVQTGPNMGPADENNQVRSIRATEPPSLFINGTLKYTSNPKGFMLIRNNPSAFKTLSPGLLVTYMDNTNSGDNNPLFTPGEISSTQLERLAEDGNTTPLKNILQ